MALQLRRGTNAERLAMTPKPGELIMVTDFLTANVPALWIGDLAGTPGGVVAASQRLDDITDVTITTATKGDLLYYNGTQWVNDNEIVSTGTANRLTISNQNEGAAAVNTALFLQKSRASSAYVDNDGTGLKFSVKGTNGTREYATITAGYSATAPVIGAYVSTNNGSSYSTLFESRTTGTTFGTALDVQGEQLRINSDSSANDATLYFKGNTAYLKYNNTSDQLEVNKKFVAGSSLIGSVKIGVDAVNEVCVDSNNLVLNTHSGYNIQSNSPIKTSAESIAINSDSTDNDSHLYFKGTDVYIRYDNAGDYLAANKNFSAPGLRGGDVQVGVANNNEVYVGSSNLLLTTDSGYTTKVNRNLDVQGDTITIGADNTNTNTYLNFKGATATATISSDGSYFGFTQNLAIGDTFINKSLDNNYSNIGTASGDLKFWAPSGKSIIFQTNGQVQGNLTITGDLAVQGTTTTIDTNNLVIEDNKITLNKNETGSGVTVDGGTAGIEIERGTQTNALWQFNESNSRWEAAGVSSSIYSPATLYSAGVLGTNANDIYFNYQNGGAAATSTLRVNRGTGNIQVGLRWNESNSRWETTTNGSTWIALPNQALDTGSSPTFNSITTTSLTANGTATFNGAVTLGDTSGDVITVNGTTTFANNVNMNGNTTIGNASTDTLTLTATTTASAPVTLNSTATFNNTATFNGNTTLGDASTDTLTINATTTQTGPITVNGQAIFNNVASFNNNVNIGDFSSDLLTVRATPTFYTNVGITDNNTTTVKGYSGTVGNNDTWIFGGAADGVNQGYAVIQTGDDGTEPIYARQTTAGVTTNQITLLDASGNTQLNDLTIGGNGYIYSSTDLALQLSGNDVSVKGDIIAEGNVIKDSTHTEVVTFTPSTGGHPGYADFNAGTNGYGINASYVSIDDGVVAINTIVYTATATTANQVLDSISSSTYRSAKYFIQASNSTHGYEVVECLVIHNGASAYIMTYGDLRSGSGSPFIQLATFEADLNSGNLRLLVTPTYADTTFKVMKTIMKV